MSPIIFWIIIGLDVVLIALTVRFLRRSARLDEESNRIMDKLEQR